MFNDVSIDLFPDEKRAVICGVERRMYGAPMRVLQALWKAAPNVVSHEDIRRLVWPDGPARHKLEGGRHVAVVISRVRKHLENSPVTVRCEHCTGYRLVRRLETL